MKGSMFGNHQKGHNGIWTAIIKKGCKGTGIILDLFEYSCFDMMQLVHNIKINKEVNYEGLGTHLSMINIILH